MALAWGLCLAMYPRLWLLLVDTREVVLDPCHVVVPENGHLFALSPYSPTAKGEATTLHPGAACQVSQMPGAIQMRCLWQEQNTQQESWQEESLWMERLRHQEPQNFHNQVLQELHHFSCDHAVTIEEVWAGNVALECLVTQIERELQMVLESLEETQQLQTSTDVAVAHECRVTEQLIPSFPTPANPPCSVSSTTATCLPCAPSTRGRAQM